MYLKLKIPKNHDHTKYRIHIHHACNNHSFPIENDIQFAYIYIYTHIINLDLSLINICIAKIININKFVLTTECTADNQASMWLNNLLQITKIYYVIIFEGQPLILFLLLASLIKLVSTYFVLKRIQ